MTTKDRILTCTAALVCGLAASALGAGAGALGSDSESRDRNRDLGKEDLTAQSIREVSFSGLANYIPAQPGLGDQAISINDSGSGGSGGVAPGPFSVVWWDNGAPDTNPEFADAKRSQTLNQLHFRAADDFLLTDGNWYYIDTIKVTMSIKPPLGVLPEDFVPEVCLELYDDCDGLPNNLLFTYDLPAAVDMGPSATNPGFNIWMFEFKIDTFVPGEVRYWISPFGKGLGQYFWNTANAGTIQGGQAKYQEFLGGPWVDADQCPCGFPCSDLAFIVTGKCCELLKDNSTFALEGLNSLSFAMPPNGQDPVSITCPGPSRAVDNFQIPPGEPRALCWIVTWFATDCLPETIRVEIYPNICDEPDCVPPLCVIMDPMIEETGQTLTYYGVPLPILKVTFKCPADCVLAPGQNYWLAVTATGDGGINGRFAVWPFKQVNDDCMDICITEGQWRNEFEGIDTFTPISEVVGLSGEPRDFAFQIWTTAATTASAQGDLPAGSTEPKLHEDGPTQNDLGRDVITTKRSGMMQALGL